jgi:hypothetical protein
MRQRKGTSTIKPPKGVPTNTECCGKERCNTGKCDHRKPWWHGGVKK